MSLNLLMEKEDDPVVWRGPLIAKTVEQFLTDNVTTMSSSFSSPNVS